MELKFKRQQYQADAAKAVTDVFAGQPNQGRVTYLRDLGHVQAKDGTEQLFGPAQLEAQEGYGNAALALDGAQLLANVRKVQRANRISESSELSAGIGACELDIEMETGTGKTYVYTKTMLELNRLYGWTKFIIVVPSVAIREGVCKSLDGTRQHFFEEYGKSVRFFPYNSKSLGDLDTFSQSPDVMAMVINMQAFNTSMKEGSSSKEARIIFSERDEFGSRRPIDVIAANRPIVIQDEPQKMGGRATQDGIRRFNPLFCLNYSATHRVRHNTVYVLDALDAFNQRLVKRIEVKGFELKGMAGTDGYLYLKDIQVSRSKPPVAVIEHKKVSSSGKVSKVTGRFMVDDSIYDASGDSKLEAYRGLVVSEIFPEQNGLPGYVRLVGEGTRIDLARGEVYGNSAGEDMRRVQIHETIMSHLEKEAALFYRGIKCLSLFFIDEVAKYRLDADDEVGSGPYAKMFDEEYDSCVEEFLDGRLPDAYTEFLRGREAAKARSAYFSIDKKGRAVDRAERGDDLRNGRGANDEDSERAYDLILRHKERLLSLDEPVRFIFSHSALREGWDNPNVFQICTLKESNSETSKRQEVGRGMRLCVNQDGERQDLAALGEQDVHEVNVLTVIASESYSSFVGDLQRDIASELRERPQKVTPALFENRTLVRKEGELVVEEHVTTPDEALVMYSFVLLSGLVDASGQPTDRFRSEGLAEADTSTLGSLEPFAEHIGTIVRSVYDPKALEGMFTNANKPVVRENRLNSNAKRAEFQRLWSMINGKHAYTVSFSDEELRQKAIARIDRDLAVSRLSYTVTTGRQQRATREAVREGNQFGGERSSTHELSVRTTSQVTYDLVGEVAQAASITRRSAAAILKGISPAKFAMFKDNPEEFIAKTGKLIVAEKASMVVEHVEYHAIDDEYEMEKVFVPGMPKDASKAIETTKNVQDYVFADSDQERAFALDLEAHDEVVVYAKLPRSFHIPTPVGNYAPDWVIAFQEGSVKHIYFVAETKGTMDSLELREVESAKISCARKLFNKVNTSAVRYEHVDSYDRLMEIMGVME